MNSYPKATYTNPGSRNNLRKTASRALAAIGVFGSLMLIATPASAYKSMADCESSEGVGQCGACSLGKGDGGFHRKKACETVVRPQLLEQVLAAEAVKTAETELGKENCKKDKGVWAGKDGTWSCTKGPRK